MTSDQCDLLLDIREQAFVCNQAYEQLATHRTETRDALKRKKEWKATNDLLAKKLLKATAALGKIIKQAHQIHIPEEKTTFVMIKYLCPELHEIIAEELLDTA